MQVLPSTAKFITSSKDVKRNNSNILKNPEINLEVGQEYILYLLELELVSNNLIYMDEEYEIIMVTFEDFKNDIISKNDKIKSKDEYWWANLKNDLLFYNHRLQG